MHTIIYQKNNFMRPDFSKVDYKSTICQKEEKKSPKNAPTFKFDEWLTAEQIPVKSTYTKEDIAHLEQLHYAAGLPPYLRGPYSTMYVNRPWTIRQYAGFSTAEESNERYHFLLKQGTTGLSVAFDLPTQIGYDSDHVLSEGEVGKAGVAIDSLADMEVLFDGIELEKITTSMTINSTASVLLCMYMALAKRQGANLKNISGTIQNDILKEYAARGTYI